MHHLITTNQIHRTILKGNFCCFNFKTKSEKIKIRDSNLLCLIVQLRLHKFLAQINDFGTATGVKTAEHHVQKKKTFT